MLSDAFIHEGTDVEEHATEGINPVGENQNRSFQFCFNGFLKVDFQGSRVTSDGGLILVRELDEHLGMNHLIELHLSDSRRGKNTQLPLADLLRQSVYSRIAATRCQRERVQQKLEAVGSILAHSGRQDGNPD